MTSTCDAPLAGLLAVELGEGVMAPFCGRLLASLGMRVVKVETPGHGDTSRARGPFPHDLPDPEASGLYAYLNRGKESVTLNLETVTGRELLRKLVGRADVLLTDCSSAGLAALGLPIGPLLAERPQLVAVTVTPWGAEGPLSELGGSDLVLYHAGGLGAMTPRFANNPQAPPLRLGAPLGEYVTGLAAAVATLHALNQVQEHGEGQHVDVSGQQAVAFTTGFYAVFPSYEHRAVSRVSRPELAPYHFLPASDGWVMLICPEEHQWRAFVRLMGSPDWAENPLFATIAGRAAYWDALEPMVAAWTSPRSRAELYHAAQAARVPLASVTTVDALLESPQLRERGFFEQVRLNDTLAKLPGSPVRSSHAAGPPAGAAPALGDSNSPVLTGMLDVPADRLLLLRSTGVL